MSVASNVSADYFINIRVKSHTQKEVASDWRSLTLVYELIVCNQNLSAKESIALLYAIFLQKLEKEL